ncbi:MAG TPA: pyruvate, phosphate dikinase [Jatrophihabitantaceae bacterium]|jgi:pyruvate,orthophosphate dikinase
MSLPICLDGTVELDRAEVGGKAWSVNHLRRLGLPVPPAFTLPTALGPATIAAGALPETALTAIDDGMRWLESELGRGFGAADRPLLVSVRSGAAQSMPGMMDTVLNIGMTEDTRKALAGERGEAFAADVQRRFAELYARVIGAAPPPDARAQLIAAVEAVFRSWESPRAVAYRRHHGLADDGGTAVTVQAMVFGNGAERSGTGVLFTRNPLDGSPAPFGEWLAGGQGEDVVSGRADPASLDELAQAMPAVHEQLLTAARALEHDARDVQDIEFTVEDGTLWLLQTRAAKRSPEAAVRIAVALHREGLLSRAEALTRFSDQDVTTLTRPRVDATGATVLATGEPASPGIASGVVVTSPFEAEDRADEGVVLATATTDPDDIRGMIAATAVITELGGATSHAAVVSRELGRTCVVGCGTGTVTGLAGRLVTVDGGTGRIYTGALPVVAPTAADDPDLAEIARWRSQISPAC